MNCVIASQLFKMRKGITWPIAAIVFCALLLLPLIGESNVTSGHLAVLEFTGNYVLGIPVGIFAALLLMADFNSGGARQIVSSGVERNQYVIGTSLSANINTALFVGAGYMVLFLIGTCLSGGNTGLRCASDVLWMVAGLLGFCFVYTSVVMLIACTFRNLGATLVLGMLFNHALLALNEGVGFVIMHLTGRLFFNIDPITRFNHVMAYEVGIQEKILTVLGFAAAGILLNVASIIVMEKKEL